MAGQPVLETLDYLIHLFKNGVNFIVFLENAYQVFLKALDLDVEYLIYNLLCLPELQRIANVNRIPNIEQDWTFIKVKLYLDE